MVKESPILFSTAMVRAILVGKKKVTRRIVKVQPDENGIIYMPNAPLDWVSKYKEEWKPWLYDTIEGERLAIHCPYGNIGDLLWVRESFTILEPEHCEGMDKRFYFKADHHETNEDWRLECIKDGYSYQWKPSIHMPKHVSRIWLEITSIRVERLWDITESDSIAEGVETLGLYPGYEVSAKGKFEGLWTNINGRESWESNPWVWVVEFKQIKK